MLPLEAAIAPKLKSLGFRKRARTWWRSNDDSIQVINLQKSPFGEELYVNLGVYIRELGSETTPPENRCHIQARLEHVIPESLYLAVSSARSSSSPTDSLIDALLIHGITWLEHIASRDGRQKFFDEPQASHCFISSLARST